jgi:hypothetical protein
VARLHFGFTDATYAYGPPRTTHDVADFLEAKYQVVERFVTDNERDIRALVKEQSERHARAVVKGRPPNNLKLTTDIKQMFKSYILRKALDGRVAGVPTLASLRGVNHKLKHPYSKKNKPRQSFYDSGLYLQNFKSWIA